MKSAIKTIDQACASHMHPLKSAKIRVCGRFLLPAARASAVTAVVLLTGLLASCSDNPDEFVVAKRVVGDISITVESRPSPPRKGHDEVVVILTQGELHKPVHDAQVLLRTTSDGDWTQAIQDGHVGVYRRAVDFPVPGDAQIEVQIKRNDRQTVIAIPVRVVTDA